MRRIGADQPRKVDVRVIAATNRDLREEVNRGSFRAGPLLPARGDAGCSVPPLRERPEDIPLLVEHFRTLAKPGDAAPPLSDETLRSFVAHPWPGNVRELRNAVERLTVLDDVPFASAPHRRPPTAAMPNPSTSVCRSRTPRTRSPTTSSAAT